MGIRRTRSEGMVWTGSNGDMRSTIAAIAFKRGCHGVREGNLGGCDLWDCG